jgi:hypothetical protein
VLAIFRANFIRADQALPFHLICDAFVNKDRGISELSEGICFLIHLGCLRRGLTDEDAFYLTELGTALIVGYRETASEWFADESATQFSDPDVSSDFEHAASE